MHVHVNYFILSEFRDARSLLIYFDTCVRLSFDAKTNEHSITPSSFQIQMCVGVHLTVYVGVHVTSDLPEGHSMILF